MIKNLATGEDITDEAEIFLNYSAKSTNVGVFVFPLSLVSAQKM